MTKLLLLSLFLVGCELPIIYKLTNNYRDVSFDNELELLRIFEKYDKEKSIELGKAILYYQRDKDHGVKLLSEIISTKNNSNQIALVHLLSHYYNNENFDMLDSLLRLDIKVTDNFLFSKIKKLHADLLLDRGLTKEAIKLYKLSDIAYQNIDTQFKLAYAYHIQGDNSKAKNLISSHVNSKKSSYTMKNNFQRLYSKIKNTKTRNTP